MGACSCLSLPNECCAHSQTDDYLACRYLNHDDALLRKRRPYAKQPVTWFRNPYAHLVLVSALPTLQDIMILVLKAAFIDCIHKC
jgi:hypothetical protein